MAQQIRFLYNELREPRPQITTQYLAQIVARTFDALDTQGATTINSTTNVTQIVAGLWTQTGNFLYPTVFPTAIILGGTNTTDLSVGGGTFVANAGSGSGFIVISAPTNATIFQMTVFGGVCSLLANKTNSGVTGSIAFALNGIEAGRFDVVSGGALFLGTTSTDIAPTKGMCVVTSAYFLITTSTNASTFQIHAGSGVFEFISSSTGSGGILPVRFSFGGTEVARFLTNGHLLVGLTSTDAASGLGDLYISSIFGILSATTNASALFLSINGTTETVIHSSFSGTGTVLPLSFYTNGVRRCTVTTAGGFIVGELSSDFFTGHCLVGDANSGMGLISAATNADVLLIREVSNLMQIDSSHSGTGTTRPLQFAMTESEIARFETTGRFLLGLTSSDASNSLGNLYISNIFGILSATTNATALFLSINGTTETVIHSSFSGTGAVKPLSLYVNATRMWTIDTSGVLIARNVSNGSYGAINGRILTPGDVIITTGYTANESYLRMEIASSLSTIESGAIGTGTILPLTFNVGTGTEVARCATTLAFLVGGTSSDAFNSAGEIASIGANSAVGAASATANASFIYLFCGGTPSVVTISSGHSGTGSTKPIAINSFGTEQARWDLTGRYLVGLTSSDSGGAGSIIASFTVQVCSAAVNSHAIVMSVNGTTETVLHSTFSGAGTSLPLSLYVNGIRGMTLTVANPVHVLIGTTVDDGTGALLQVHGTISSNGTVLTVP